MTPKEKDAQFKAAYDEIEKLVMECAEKKKFHPQVLAYALQVHAAEVLIGSVPPGHETDATQELIGNSIRVAAVTLQKMATAKTMMAELEKGRKH